MENKRRNKRINKDVKDNRKSTSKNKKNVKHIIIMLIWILIVISLIYQVVMFGLYTLGKVNKTKIPLYTVVDNLVTKYYPKYFEEEEEYTINVTALGNIYTSKSVEYQYNNKDLDTVLNNVKESIKESDLVIANLRINELNKASNKFNENVISSFNKIGVDVFTTANETNFKKNKSQIDEVNNIITNTKVSQVGMNNKPYIYEKDSLKIGILSYYLNLDKNEVPVEGANKHIKYYTDENLKNDIKYLEENNTDFIIAYLDYTNDDIDRISLIQKQYAEKMFLNNVNAVFEVGSSAVKETYEDIYNMTSGGQNHGYVMYSLGDMFGYYEKEFDVATSGEIKFTKKIIKDNLGNILEDKTVKYMTVNNPEIYYTNKYKNNINIYSITDMVKDNNIDESLKKEGNDIIREYEDKLNIKTIAKSEEKDK